MMTVSFLLFGDLCISKKRETQKKRRRRRFGCLFRWWWAKTSAAVQLSRRSFLPSRGKPKGLEDEKKKDEKRKKKNKKKKKSVGHPVDPSTGWRWGSTWKTNTRKRHFLVGQVPKTKQGNAKKMLPGRGTSRRVSAAGGRRRNRIARRAHSQATVTTTVHHSRTPIWSTSTWNFFFAAVGQLSSPKKMITFSKRNKSQFQANAERVQCQKVTMSITNCPLCSGQRKEGGSPVGGGLVIKHRGQVMIRRGETLEKLWKKPEGEPEFKNWGEKGSQDGAVVINASSSASHVPYRLNFINDFYFLFYSVRGDGK